MFDIGLQEMVVIAVIALLVFGPSKLPELGRMFGRAMREFRRASDEFRSAVETNLHINDPYPNPTPDAAVSSVAATDVTPLPSEAEAVATEPITSPTGERTSANLAARMLAQERQEAYCAQRGARLFHQSDCAWARRIPDIDRVPLKRVADARDQGFVECPVCQPWEPA